MGRVGDRWEVVSGVGLVRGGGGVVVRVAEERL